MKFFTILLVLSLPFFFVSQNMSQTFRGTVVDKQTQGPLPGATVVIVGTDPAVAVQTDSDGKFHLENMQLGRSHVKFMFTGYKEKTITVNLTSGKQLVMVVELEESVSEMQEVTVVAETDKTKSNNKTATVSARQFSVEDAQRYAGSRNDPARMAANFAGVSGANDSRNDIIIRGNSPLGVLWRLNGIDIPNPNHFGSLGSTGGPVSILNTNTLDNSDFLSGAFPAEYGNATAGVFDLKMRPGNNEKYEFLGQVGFNGFEVGAEGPFSKKKNSSFLINYRYSTLEVFKALGMNFGTGAAVPQYQDLTFNAVFPTKKYGKFQFYGIGGISYIEFLDSQKDKSENLYGYSGQDTWYWSNVGVTGMSHTYLINSSSYTKFNLVGTVQTNKIIVDRVDTSFTPVKTWPLYRNNSRNGRAAMNFTYHKKFNAKNNISSGIFLDVYNILMVDSVSDDSLKFSTLRDFEGLTELVQAYVNWQHRFSDKVSLNTGLHYQQLLLNNSLAVEPRAGLKWALNDKHTLSWGAGLHSQMQPVYIYFSTAQNADGRSIETNRNIGFTKSAQAIMAYDVLLGKNARVKTELYYQYLFDVPVKVRPGYFSSLNLGADFNSPNVDSLTNKGLGTNYGLEFTLEKFFSQGYYYLVTASLFESKYTGSDDIWRNTAFNGNYVLNALGGKEFKFKDGKHVLAIDIKLTYAGGKRYVPIDLNASIAMQEEHYIESQAYDPSYPSYFRMDIKPSYRLNKKKMTLEWNIDLQNVTDHKNVFQQTYDVNASKLRYDYQLGLFVVPQFRILF